MIPEPPEEMAGPSKVEKDEIVSYSVRVETYPIVPKPTTVDATLGAPCSDEKVEKFFPKSESKSRPVEKDEIA